MSQPKRRVDLKRELHAEFQDLEVWNEAVRILCKAQVEIENFDRTLPGQFSNPEDPYSYWRVFYPADVMFSRNFGYGTCRGAEREMKELGLDSTERSQVRRRVQAMSLRRQEEISGEKVQVKRVNNLFSGR